jgi:hypothetical protein
MDIENQLFQRGVEIIGPYDAPKGSSSSTPNACTFSGGLGGFFFSRDATVTDFFTCKGPYIVRLWRHHSNTIVVFQLLYNNIVVIF